MSNERVPRGRRPEEPLGDAFSASGREDPPLPDAPLPDAPLPERAPEPEWGSPLEPRGNPSGEPDAATPASEFPLWRFDGSWSGGQRPIKAPPIGRIQFALDSLVIWTPEGEAIRYEWNSPKLHIVLSRVKGSLAEEDNTPTAEWFLEAKNPKTKGWLPSEAHSAFAATASRLRLDLATEVIQLNGPVNPAYPLPPTTTWLVRSTIRRRRG